MIESSCGVRQGSALSSLYFCALLQGPLKEVASLYPEVKIRAYQDDVTMSSTNSTSLAAAFLHLRESTQDLNLEINFNKCEWFKSSKTQEFDASPLRTLGVKKCEDSIKVLGGYIGRDKIVEEKLLEKMSKHECLFRRLRIMGPSNLSLAILKRCTVPRQDYHLRVHKPVATLSLAEEFDKEIQSVMMKWCGANGDSLKLATLPCKLGGLGIISTVVKQRYFFEASRKSIEELFKPTNAPVGCTGTQTSQSLMKSQNQASRTQLKKQMKSEHETLATKLNENPSIARITKRSKESNVHLDSAHNYVNPYLFKYTLMMRLGVSITKAPKDIACPGCGVMETPSSIMSHVAGCSRCSGMNCTRKHSHIVRYLADLCTKAGLPYAIEPRIHSSFFCTKCKCSFSSEAAEDHPCRARRIRSGPDLAIMWPNAGEMLYDITVVHTCCSSYIKKTSSALLQNALDRKKQKYIEEKGLDPEFFRCIAVTDCGLLHDNTKNLIKTLANRANLSFEATRQAFQLEIEKFAAYTVVSQLRNYVSEEKWVGGIRA